MTPWLTYLTTGLSHCISMATTLNAFYKLVSSKAQSSGLTFDAKNVYSGHLIKMSESNSSLHLFVIRFPSSRLEMLLLRLCGLLTHLSTCVVWHILSISVNLSFFLD